MKTQSQTFLHSHGYRATRQQEGEEEGDRRRGVEIVRLTTTNAGQRQQQHHDYDEEKRGNAAGVTVGPALSDVAAEGVTCVN